MVLGEIDDESLFFALFTYYHYSGTVTYLSFSTS